MLMQEDTKNSLRPDQLAGGLAGNGTISKVLMSAIVVALICAAVAATHWPALSAKALVFDDDQYFIDNEVVQNPTWASARQFLTEVLEPSTVTGYYQPLTMISLMLDCAAGATEENLRPFHRTSLAFHVANTVLIIILLYMLFGHFYAAALIGLLFGLHPMTVEPIPWIGERKTLLATFFALWCLIFYVRFARRKNWKLYIASILFFVLALMSKPTTTPMPLLLLLLDYWPLRRLSRKAGLEKIPFLALAVLSGIIAYISQSRTCGATLPTEYGPERIPLTICHNIIFYPYKMLWPVNLSSHYAFPRPLALSDPMVLAGVIGTIILIPLLITSLRWTRAALTSWLFFFIAVLPTMQIVGFSNVIASDKFAYLPSIGFLMGLTALLVWLTCKMQFAKPSIRWAIVTAIVLTAAGGEALATRRYLAKWQDTVIIHKHMLALVPNATWLNYNLAKTLMSQGKTEEARTYALKAEESMLEEEADYHQQQLRKDPDSPQIHNELAITLAKQGKFDEAMGHFNQALSTEPDNAIYLYNTGNALRLQGKADEAIEYYRRALAKEPAYAEAHNNLAVLLMQKGEYKQALTHFRTAARLRPAWPPPLCGVASILASSKDPQVRDVDAAVALAERVAELVGYRDAGVLDTLAAAYAAAGQFDKTIPQRKRKTSSTISTKDWNTTRTKSFGKNPRPSRNKPNKPSRYLVIRPAGLSRSQLGAYRLSKAADNLLLVAVHLLVRQCSVTVTEQQRQRDTFSARGDSLATVYTYKTQVLKVCRALLLDRCRNMGPWHVLTNHN